MRLEQHLEPVLDLVLARQWAKTLAPVLVRLLVEEMKLTLDLQASKNKDIGIEKHRIVSARKGVVSGYY